MSLSDELFTGTLSSQIAPFILEGNDGAIMELLNVRSYFRLGKINKNDFILWATETGMRAVIEDEAADKTSPLRSSALTLIGFMTNPVSELDFSNLKVQGILDLWVSSGKLSEANKQSLLALAQVPISWAELTIGRNVFIEEIASTLRPGV